LQQILPQSPSPWTCCYSCWYSECFKVGVLYVRRGSQISTYVTPEL